jgi:hypothetical protein
LQPVDELDGVARRQLSGQAVFESGDEGNRRATPRTCAGQLVIEPVLLSECRIRARVDVGGEPLGFGKRGDQPGLLQATQGFRHRVAQPGGLIRGRQPVKIPRVVTQVVTSVRLVLPLPAKLALDGGLDGEPTRAAHPGAIEAVLGTQEVQVGRRGVQVEQAPERRAVQMTKIVATRS